MKNLPKHVAEDRLRDFFSQKGEVTDAKLMRTKYFTLSPLISLSDLHCVFVCF